MKKNKKGIFYIVIVFFTIGIMAIGGLRYTKFGNNLLETITGIPSIAKYQKGILEMPTGIVVNEDDKIITWNPVKNAEYYYVCLNKDKGKMLEKVVTENSICYVEIKNYYFFKDDIMNIQIQARAEDYISKLYSFDYTLQKQDEEAYKHITREYYNFVKSFSYDSIINNIDFLVYKNNEIATCFSGEWKEKEYFSYIYGITNKELYQDTSLRSFCINLERLNSTYERNFNSIEGEVFEDIVDDTMLDYLQINDNDLQRNISYNIRQSPKDGKIRFYYYIETKQNDVISYKLYEITCEDYFLQTYNAVFNLFNTDISKFTITLVSSFEQNISEISPYIERLNNDVVEYSKQLFEAEKTN